MMEYVDPLDHGERFVAEWLSGLLWGKTDYRWAIVDRNTGELMRKIKGRHGNQPDAKGQYIWRGDEEQARWWCDRLNAEVKPRAMDPGTGPEKAARHVDVGVLIGQARQRKRVTAPPAVFIRCDSCTKCHRSGPCPT
jgi:hypothetical protein